MEWEQNKIYKVKPGYFGSYRIKVVGDRGVYVDSDRVNKSDLLAHFNRNAFEEVKPKKAFLPEWL